MTSAQLDCSGTSVLQLHFEDESKTKTSRVNYFLFATHNISLNTAVQIVKGAAVKVLGDGKPSNLRTISCQAIKI